MTEPAGGVRGLIASLTELFRTAVAALLASLQVRVSLLAFDLETERRYFMRALAMGALMLFFLGLACIFLSLWVIMYFWRERVWTVAILGGSYLLLGLFTAWRLRRDFRQRPALLSATLGELKRDRAAARA